MDLVKCLAFVGRLGDTPYILLRLLWHISIFSIFSMFVLRALYGVSHNRMELPKGFIDSTNLCVVTGEQQGMSARKTR